jgi:hypothetical protein
VPDQTLGNIGALSDLSQRRISVAAVDDLLDRRRHNLPPSLILAEALALAPR